jgi:uncharacterized protein (DUF983 family)
MIKKGNKLYSILKFRCPQCHEGDFFLSSSYNLLKSGETHVHCEKCNLKFSKEPGFYYGAMYISYAISVAIFIAIWATTLVLNIDLKIFELVVLIASVLIGVAPFTYHLSKIIWANLFFSYKEL